MGFTVGNNIACVNDKAIKRNKDESNIMNYFYDETTHDNSSINIKVFFASHV